jgi:hypothetical protein
MILKDISVLELRIINVFKVKLIRARETYHTPHSEAEMRDTCLSGHTDWEEHYALTECYNCHFFE